MPIVSNEKCQRYNADEICVGDKDGGESICYGDMGGPLVPVGWNDDTAIIIGVASHVMAPGPNNPMCGAEGFPSVFVYVPYYLEWIKDLMS